MIRFGSTWLRFHIPCRMGQYFWTPCLIQILKDFKTEWGSFVVFAEFNWSLKYSRQKAINSGLILRQENKKIETWWRTNSWINKLFIKHIPDVNFTKIGLQTRKDFIKTDYLSAVITRKVKSNKGICVRTRTQEDFNKNLTGFRLTHIRCRVILVWLLITWVSCSGQYFIE